MNETIKIVLPKLGESILSATIVQWFKKVGDRVALDEPLLEVSTDKVNSEIPAPAEGVLQEILVEPNQEVQVGQPLALLARHQDAFPVLQPEFPLAKKETPRLPVEAPGGMEDFLSPSVMRLLKEKGLPLDEADRIPRTGQGGRLTKKDVEEYASLKSSSHEKETIGTERVKMSALRKAIADNMVRSFYEAPHASLATEVDVTGIVQHIQAQKRAFFQDHGVKLSITAFVAQAIAQALQEYPLLNASLEGDTIIMKRFVNLGMAVSVDQGVMVPVIRNCQQLDLPSIAKEIAQMAEKARSHKLEHADVQEGTITMTNFGMTGVMLGIPIIRYPEVAIVGLGTITRKAVPMPDDSIAIRSVLWISLTFDHRVLDGIYGCGFLGALRQRLGAWVF
ncbi:MAG: 2-oxo acid dehydrogenase subunit E2 [Chlamydiia bacterium]|nr:2-oxo acid dehydrogenase subunit E2 [Chlamydiia bacterium]